MSPIRQLSLKTLHEQPKEYMVEKRTVDNKTILNMDMAKGGGFVIRLEAEN